MDYTLPTLQHQLDSNRHFTAMLMEQMSQETEFIFSCLENMSITMEAVDNENDKRNFFQKMIDFIKALLGKFIDKTKALFQGNEKWLKENLPALKKIDFESLEISMTPLWNKDAKKIESDHAKIKSKVLSVSRSNNLDDYKTMDDVKTKLFGEFLDENDDLAAGLKNMYRVGKAKGPIKPVSVRGSQLKTLVINEFHPYCLGYVNNVSASLKKMVADAERDMKTLNQAIRQKKAVKENFCIVEDAPYSKTEVALCENYVVMEAEQPAEKKPEEKKPEPTATNKEKSASPTKVQLTDHGDKETSDKMATYSDMSSEMLKVTKNLMQVTQTSITAAMTVSEERFNVYMKTMKQIVGARKQKDVKK